MELSELNNIKRYMTTYELQYRPIVCNPQRHQLTTTFHHTIEEVFETLEIEDVDTSIAHSTIDPIVNRKSGKNIYQHNRPNHRQHVHTTKAKQYQYISFQRSRTSSITYLKEDCHGCELSNKRVRESSMQHDKN